MAVPFSIDFGTGYDIACVVEHQKERNKDTDARQNNNHRNC